MSETPTATELIKQAFAVARQSGKDDWWAMRSPVLKNRLLLLTKNTFNEADFGAVSFRDFLSKVGDIVRIDETSVPPFVILKSAAPEDTQRTPANLVRREQVRADLWRAVLDYSSGNTYVWDISQEVARPATPEDGGLVLPTIAATDLDDWRADFIELHRSPNPEDAKRVEAWYKNRLPTGALPTLMRAAWNRHLKRKVQDRLRQWFASNSIEPPAIIEERQEAGLVAERVEALREFIIDCVKAMSKQELLELRISPATAMRALRGRPGNEH